MAALAQSLCFAAPAHLTAIHGGQMPGAAVTEPASIKPILDHLGLPTEPPRVAPARGPPDESLAFDQSPRHDPSVPEPAPEYEFDQRLTW